MELPNSTHEILLRKYLNDYISNKSKVDEVSTYYIKGWAKKYPIDKWHKQT